MPACRQMSLTGTPASACLRIETIWVSVKRDFFMEPPGWGKHARTFYLWGVCGSGKLTIPAACGSALADMPRHTLHMLHRASMAALRCALPHAARFRPLRPANGTPARRRRTRGAGAAASWRPYGALAARDRGTGHRPAALVVAAAGVVDAAPGSRPERRQCRR